MNQIEALRLALAALNKAPRFKVPGQPPAYNDSYKIAAVIEEVLANDAQTKAAAAAYERFWIKDR